MRQATDVRRWHFWKVAAFTTALTSQAGAVEFSAPLARLVASGVPQAEFKPECLPFAGTVPSTYCIYKGLPMKLPVAVTYLDAAPKTAWEVFIERPQATLRELLGTGALETLNFSSTTPGGADGITRSRVKAGPFKGAFVYAHVAGGELQLVKIHSADYVKRRKLEAQYAKQPE